MATKKTIEETGRRMGTPAFVTSVLALGVIIIAGAVFLGKSDQGQIDVTAAIQNSNQANADAGGDASGNVQVVPEAFRNMSNGGLVAQESQPAETQNNPEVAPSETGEEVTSTSESETTAVETSTEATETQEEGVSETETQNAG